MTTTTAINALIMQSTQEHHDLGDGAITVEYITQLVEGVTLHFFPFDYSAKLLFDKSASELEFFLDDEIAEVLINREVSSVSDFFGAVAGVGV